MTFKEWERSTKMNESVGLEINYNGIKVNDMKIEGKVFTASCCASVMLPYLWHWE
jgi:hypothetical protein